MSFNFQQALKNLPKLLLVLLLNLPGISQGQAEDDGQEEVFQEPGTFIRDAFPGSEPKAQVLWLTKDVKPDIRKIMGHDYPAARIRYWQAGSRTAWILEEIGKVKPITTGIVVEDGIIINLQVLIYRESHGWEVKYPFFTDQFTGAGQKENFELDKNIDGISGATLSVNAIHRLAELALYLHQTAIEK